MKQVDEPLLDVKSSRVEDEIDRLPIQDRIRSLLMGQRFGVLCTSGSGQPYGSLVAYAVQIDLRHLTFATTRATRKYRLISECNRVAFVIDSRPSQVGDMMRVEAVTLTGRALELASGSELDRWAALLVDRHPQLEGFVRAPTSAVFRVDITRYLHVSRFQEVTQWVP